MKKEDKRDIGGKNMVIDINPRRVANQLKRMVNAQCQEGFVWFEDVTDEGMTIFDVCEAIKILEKAKVEKMEVTE